MAKAGMSTYLFPLGLLLAFIGAFFTNEYVVILMGIIGLLVGFLNFQQAEGQKGLLFVIALFLSGTATAALSTLGMVGNFLGPILTNIASFFTFAAIAMLMVAGYRLLRK